MSAANRGTNPTSRRKRARDEDEDIDMLSSSPPAGIPSSPPLPALNENDELDDDDDIRAEDDLIQDIDDADEMAEDEDGIDLFGDNFMRDERERGLQDTYQGRMIDDEGDFDDLDLADRRQLEARLNKRDRELARQDDRKFLFNGSGDGKTSLAS